VCGHDGNNCVACGAGETCTAGACVLTCDDTTCGGCCQNGVCADAGIDQACGAGGVACAACATDQHCWASNCLAFGTVSFTYYLNGSGCQTNPACTTQVDFTVSHAASIATLYANAGCSVSNNAGPPPFYGINCLAICNYNSMFGCCGGYPAGADQSTCSWTPP
jgi:hypothetical protein